MSPTRRRRLGAATAALAVMASALTVLTAGTAQARPVCWFFYGISHDATQQIIVAEADVVCEPGVPVPQVIARVQQQNPATGAWTTVASSTGTAPHSVVYRCVGTATTNYRTGPTFRDRSVTASCG